MQRFVEVLGVLWAEGGKASADELGWNDMHSAPVGAMSQGVNHRIHRRRRSPRRGRPCQVAMNGVVDAGESVETVERETANRVNGDKR